MNEIFDRNKILLQKYQPNTYKKLILYLNGEYKPKVDRIHRIVVAQQDEIIINMLLLCDQKEYLLFNHEDPIGQAYDWIDKYIDPSNKAEIVFGLGFGFHIEVLLTSFKNKKVLIIEPNIELFYQILKVRNLGTIIEKSKILVNEEINIILNEVYSLYWDPKEGGIQCQPFEVYGEIFEDLWYELSEKFIKQAQSFNVDMATRRFFGDLWIHNCIKNLFKISEASNADGFVGMFRDVPGILVSAGPSLEKNIHLLKDLKDKCIIMAGGAAVNILEKNGITPHFMVGIDASESETQVHRSVESSDISFIYSNQIAEGSLNSYKGPKFLMNYSNDTYTIDFLKFSDIKGQCFLSGPSVSNTCFDILFKMGCNPIILIGQDLAYTKGQVYAGGNSEIALNSNKKVDDGYLLTRDIYGDEIYTSLIFMAMKNFFEINFERVHEKVEIINATEGGLNIEFAKNEKLEDVIKNTNFKHLNIEGIINSIYEKNRFLKTVEDKLKEYNDSIILEMNRIEDYSKKQLKFVDLLKRDFYHPNKNKKTFEKMVKSISQFTDLIMESPMYKSVLNNLLHIDFYLLKVEVERATVELQNYNEVKDIYINAIIEQNKILNEKLQKIRKYILKSL